MATKQWIGTTDGDWNTAGNWSASGVPSANDNVYVPDGATVAIDGYDNSGTALSSFEVKAGSTTTFGSIASGIVTSLDLDVGGTGDSFFTYRAKSAGYFTVENAAVIAILGGPSSSISSGGLHIVGGVDNDAVYVNASGAYIGLGWKPGNVFETDALELSQGNLYIGPLVVKKDGSTALSPSVSGGTGTCLAPLVTLNLYGGSWVQDNATITTANIYGRLEVLGTGTITTLNVKAGGTVDLSTGNGTLPVTNTITLGDGATFNDPSGRVASPTFDIGDLNRTSVTIVTPQSWSITR